MARQKADRHLWRTADGKLVEAGDPAGQVLAYAPGDELSDTDAKDTSSKAKTKPADKSRAKPEDK